MAETSEEKAKRLKEDYLMQPCGRHHEISIDELSEKISIFSKEVSSKDCVIDFLGSGICAIQGGVIPMVADFAGVYLARMNSDGPGITPLAKLSESYFKPFIFGVDRRIIASAAISEITEARILVSVIVENEKGNFMGMAELSFAKKF